MYTTKYYDRISEQPVEQITFEDLPMLKDAALSTICQALLQED
jgi:arylamine N-acetyltransferase